MCGRRRRSAGWAAGKGRRSAGDEILSPPVDLDSGSLMVSKLCATISTEDITAICST